MKITCVLLAFGSLAGCAGLQKSDIREPYEQIKLGTAIACTVIDPDMLEPQQREYFLKGCVIAADAIERIDSLILGGAEQADGGVPTDQD